VSERQRFLIVVGAMKCGTTSLFQYLAAHPEVAPSSPKQVNFFSDDARWARGPGYYLGHWPASAGTRTRLEASPAYSDPDRAAICAERMASLDADLRLVYLVRDPYERIESHWFHGRHRGEFSDCASLSEALRTRPTLLDTTRYCRWIEAYRTHFGDDRFRVVRSSRLEEEPAQLLAELCRFAGLDADFAFPDLRTRYNTREAQLADHPLVERMQGMRRLRNLVRRLLPLRLRERLKRRLKPVEEAPTPDRLGPEDRAFVAQALAGDLACLEGEES